MFGGGEMDEFTFDEKIREYKVGRTLTVRRVEELNSKDYFYKVLKENPNIRKIYPGIENNLLEGAIDHHIHSYPDFVYRTQDMFEIALDAAKAKMRAVCFKDHYNLTANCAYLVQRYIDELVDKEELDHRIEVYGGIGLNFSIDPEIVKKAVEYPNMKMVWFPTFNSAGYLRGAGKSGGLPLIDSNDNVLPEVEQIMEIAAKNKIGIGFGHTDFKELRPLAEKAEEIGVRAVLDHPLLELNKLTLDEIRELSTFKTTYVGVYCQPMIPSLYQPVADPSETIKVIEEIGSDKCIIASDFGQVLHIDTIDGIRIFIRALLGFGISEKEIETMIKYNPAKLLYLI
jgi:hypothetical protein